MYEKRSNLSFVGFRIKFRNKKYLEQFILTFISIANGIVLKSTFLNTVFVESKQLTILVFHHE